METEDAGDAYLEKMIFFGESTTAHLRARGGLAPSCVWCDNSGTKTLTSKLTSEPIVYPRTGELLTLAEACRQERPAYMVLSFGLNGIMGFVAEPSSFIRCYTKLIDTVQSASPNTKILLQTVYPVVKSTGFSVDADTLNRYIDTVNGLLPQIAAAREEVRIVDTASVLRDEQGMPIAAYYDPDGLHLLSPAYQQIIGYLRTHAWRES